MDEAKISQGTDGLYLENFYTPLEEAKNELWKRWNDKALRREVDKFLKGAIPEFLQGIPKAVSLVYIATPDLYSARFLELAEKVNLKPIFLENPEDKFYPGNPDKYYLGKFLFYNGKGKHGGIKISNLTVIDFNKSQGTKLSELKTLWGEYLYNFHQRLVAITYNDNNASIINWSEWLSKYIPYYYYYYTLFICNAIYFETFFVNSESEKEFIEKVILPNFNKVYNHFGLKPLIVPIVPFSEEGDIYWWCYQESIKSIVFESINQAEGPRFETKTDLFLD